MFRAPFNLVNLYNLVRGEKHEENETLKFFYGHKVLGSNIYITLDTLNTTLFDKTSNQYELIQSA